MVLGAALAVGCDSREKGGEEADEPTDFAGQLALAKTGNVAAEYNVAVCYMTGNGVASNMQAGVEWMVKAAMHGVADAQFNLGVMFAVGMGVPTSGDESVKWYRQAAERGHVMAQVNLGIAFAGELASSGVGRKPPSGSNWQPRLAT